MILHSYDEEWRLIFASGYMATDDRRLIANAKPTKIILGLKISDDDKKAVLMAARHVGIENIEQMIINDDDEFVSEPIK